MAMNGLFKMAATAFLIVMVIVPAAVAVTYKVGDDKQWTTGEDYTAWTAGKTFKVGDTLEFIYGPSHSVSVVNKAGYDACDGSSASDSFAGGDTKIILTTLGPKYYLCPVPGHCQSGMKLTVTVVAAGTPDAASPPPSSPGTPDAPSPPPKTPGTPPTPADSPPADTPPAPATATPKASPPPPPKGSGASKGVIMSYVLVGVTMVLGYGLLM